MTRGGRNSAICYICHSNSRHMHEHHVTMRARTGELGPKVWLCGTCHTEIHAIASARVAKMRGGNSTVITEWAYQRHPNERTYAERLITALVEILLRVDNADLPRVTSLTLPFEINQGLALLKRQMGFKNKSEAILFCCSKVLGAAGLLLKTPKPKQKSN